MTVALPRPEQAENPSSRTLVINADDFGLCPSVNRGILEAHDAGVVTSASLMVNLPGFADALVRARRAPTLGIGLHLNLTAGAPVAGASEVPTLCDRRTGRFLTLPRLAARAIAGRIAAQDVETECTAQIGRLRAEGIALTHLDGHRHVHLLPGLWRPVRQAALQAGIAQVRLPLEPLAHVAGRVGSFCEQLALRGAYYRAGRDPVARAATQFRGSALLGHPRYLEELLKILDGLRPGVTELMVHPGYGDVEIARWDRYNWERESELRALLDPTVRGRLARGDVRLAHFGTAAWRGAGPPAPPAGRRLPRFSVVIPAYNEARYLPRLLDSLDAARTAYAGPPEAIEVIVADNGSTDATRAIARRRGCRVARESKRVIGAARNAGAALASGEILAFIDADSRIHPDTFRAIDEALTEAAVGGATGVTMDGWGPGVLLLFAAQELAGRVTGWDTGLVFCRQADFAALGGYDESLTYGEDFAFFGALQRLGRPRRQRFVRLRGVRAVTSSRKFEQFGAIKWPLANLTVLGLSAVRSRRAHAMVQRYWYRARL